MPQTATTILNYIKERWVLLLALVVFILFKLPHLHVPFYWDESWSYQPAIQLMYKHGPSLMPNAIDTAFSRGHPLLFYFSVAAWMRLFGPGAFSQHIFALLLSVLLIITVYEVCLRLFNKRTAILTLAILPLQVIFFVQSAMLLPEVMVALLSLLSIYFYGAGKRMLTFLALLALVLTKESGMVVGLLLGADASIKLFNKNTPLKERALNLLPVVLAGIGIATFFMVQRQVNGWFLFPEHVGYISFEWNSIWGKIKGILEILFTAQMRFLLFQIVLFFALVAAINTHKIKYLLPLLIALLVYYCLNEMYYDIIPRQVLISVVAASFIAAIFQLSSFTIKGQQKSRRFIYLAISFLIMYTTFSSINFLTGRYVIPALAIIVILTAYYLDRLIAFLYDPIYLVVVVVIILIGRYALQNNDGYGDCDMGAFAAMKVQQDEVKYLEQNNLYNAYIATTNYQDYVHLKDPYTGFIKKKEFAHVDGWMTDSTQYVLFNNIEAGRGYDSIKNGFKQIYRFEYKGRWAEIYKLK